MPFCAPQRYVANNRNLLLAATLTPSSVMPIDDQVIETPQARVGSGAVVVEGSYTGAAPAVYDVEVLDETIDQAVVTKPVAIGEGSGTLENIVAGTTTPQDFVVELQNDGIPELAAGVDFEGVRIVARTSGDAGNSLSLSIDRSGLVFTAQAYSLLNDLPAGSGGPTDGLIGPEYDFDTKVLGVDNLVPATAHRIAFGDDTSAVYLQYKKFTDGEWHYHFIPAIKRAISAGTIVNFVSGARTVNVEDSAVVVETFADVVTVYDLLNAIKTTSTYLDVSGVVAYDRSPTGQASREILLRTDAHCELSTGSGSKYATGFVDAFANDNAATELVTAECIAVTSKDHPLARVGYERWQLLGSVSGALGDIVTADPFLDPDGKFGLTIPRKLPSNYGGFSGLFSHIATNYVPRDEDEKPPLCPVALTLGAAAVDQIVTLTWTQRPSGDCACKALPIPRLSSRCLGLSVSGQGEPSMYQTDTQLKLVSMYDWYADVVRAATSFHMDGSGIMRHYIVEPNEDFADGFTVESLQDIVARFEESIAEIDPLEDTGLRAAGMYAWDVSFAELQTDVDALTDGSAGTETVTGLADETLAANDAVVMYNNGTENRVRLAVPLATSTGAIYGFVDAGYVLNDPVTVRRTGIVSGQTGLTKGSGYVPKLSIAGEWTIAGVDFIVGAAGGVALSTTEISVGLGSQGNGTGFSELLLSERYRSRLNWVAISGGISPLGKSDADSITSGDGCWRDLGGDYWTVVGSENGAYAPCFNNAPYYASRTSADGKKYFSTHEFGFQINVKCPELLVFGDEIVLRIGNAGGGSGGTYQVGDKLVLPIIAGQNLDLVGGQDGDEALLWYVTGTVAGPLAPFAYDPDAPSSYVVTGVLSFDYVPGGIPNRKGDRFTFSVEGGHYRWRKDGGSWMTGTFTIIDEASAALDEGLTLRFVPGASPSFVSEDRFTFRALQPWAVDNVKSPDALKWKWSGSTPTLNVEDIGSIQPVTAALIARHTMPVGSTITLHGGDAAANEWSEALTWREGVIFHEFTTTTRTARYLQFEITGATDASIGWAWAGVPLTTELSADVQVRPSYRIETGSTKIDQGGRYLAKATSGTVKFSDVALKDADVDGLLAMIDHAKRNDDEPFVIVPNVERPDEAYLTQIAIDEFNFEEVTGNNATPGIRERRYSIGIPLTGVWQ